MYCQESEGRSLRFRYFLFGDGDGVTVPFVMSATVLTMVGIIVIVRLVHVLQIGR